MPETTEHIQPVDWEAVRRKLAEAEGEDQAAEFVAEVLREEQRLSKATHGAAIETRAPEITQ